MIKELQILIDKKENLSPYVFENYHGIRLPELRKIAKQIAKEKRYDFFKEDHTCFEEETIHAYAIGYCKEDINTLLSFVDQYIPRIKSWSTNDSLCQNMKFARKYQKEVFDYLLTLVPQQDEWKSRVVSVTLLSHYLNDEYIDRVLKILDVLYKETYFSKMGIAWAIATCMAKYPQKTFEYLKTCSLDKWTYNKSLQKMIESFRVKESDKLIIKTMKKA